MLPATLALLSGASMAQAGECDKTVKKSGNPFSGNVFTATADVPDTSVQDVLAQMKGLLIAKKLDVTAEDEDGLLGQSPAMEGQQTAMVVNQSYRGKLYTLSGRINTPIEDSPYFSVGFDIPTDEELSRLGLKPPGSAPRVAVTCHFPQSAVGSVMRLKEGQKVKMTGTYDKFTTSGTSSG